MIFLGAASAVCAVLVASQAPFEAHVVGFLAALALWTGISFVSWKEVSLSPRRWGDEAGLARLVLAVAVLVRLPLLAVDPSPSTDAYRYSWEGRIANAGRDPYRTAPDAPSLGPLRTEQDARVNHPGLTAIYPPLALAAFRAAAYVSGDIHAVKALFTLSDLLCCALLIRLLKRRGLSAAWAALYAWHPLVAVEFSAAGHLDSLMILGLLGGIDLWESGHRDSAALAWAAGALVKVVPVLILPWLLLRRPRSALLFAAAVAAGLLTAVPDLVAAMSGAPGNGIVAFSTDWLANPSLFVATAAVTDSPGTARLVAGCVVGLFSLFWASRSGDDPARHLRGTVMFVLLASPVVQPWYVLWALPLALLSPSTAALAWASAVGFLYIVLDPALKAASVGIPIWQWLWGAEYAMVFGLLARDALRRENSTSAERHVHNDLQGAPPMKRSVVLIILLAASIAVPACAQSDRLKLSETIQSLTFSGDLRLRNDISRRRGAGLNDRGRLRYRLRLAAEALLPEDFAVVLRLGSGTGEQISTNQSADNLSSQKAIWIDLAHLRWTPKLHEDAAVRLLGGRILNPLWRVYSSDLVWDEDFNPEGAGESFEWKLPGWGGSVFANGVQGVADEDSNSGKNQWYFSQQLGFEKSFRKESRLRLAAAYHKWSDASRSSFGQTAVQDGNRRLPNGTLANSFGIGEVTGELRTKVMTVPFSAQATATRNLLARANSTTLTGPISRDGYQFGFIGGHAKAKGDWEAAYFKKYVQTETAVADVADSDFGDGGLNRAGHIAWVAYAPRDWMQLKLKGFVTDTLDRTFAPGDKAVNRLQADVSVRF